jgi:hypothetical protein
MHMKTTLVMKPSKTTNIYSFYYIVNTFIASLIFKASLLAHFLSVAVWFLYFSYINDENNQMKT